MISLHECKVSAMDMMPVLIERLSEGQTVSGLQFSGRSMLPMLRQGRDTVELSALPQTLRRYDLPVYRGKNGKFVMHRIVRVEAEHYVCLGDNTYGFEHVQRSQMAAVVSAFTRDGRRISVNSAGYRLYCRVWCAIIPLRRLAMRVRFRLSRHRK